MHYYKIVQHNRKHIDNVLKTKYSASFMSNTKWEKLMRSIETEFNEVYINYKLIYGDEIEGYIFTSVDVSPYFIEPIFYKEVEWIEFPKAYTWWVNENNLKAGKTHYTQNIHLIKTIINKLGVFKIDEYEDRIRLYAYL